MIPKLTNGIWSTFLLILIIILAVSSLPSATSQQFTTSTVYSTQSQMNTYYSASYYTQTTTETYSGTASLIGVVTACNCYLAVIPFYATGAPVEISFSASQPLSAIVTDASKTIYYESSSPVYSATFTVNLPANGKLYGLGLITTGPQLVSPTVYVTIGPIMWVSSSTATIPVASTATITITSALTLEQPSGTGYSVLLLWCFAIAAVVIFAIWFGPFRKKTKPVEQQVQQPEPKPTTTTSKVSGKQFCLECGNELPLGSKFCNKCGSKQQG